MPEPTRKHNVTCLFVPAMHNQIVPIYTDVTDMWLSLEKQFLCSTIHVLQTSMCDISCIQPYLSQINLLIIDQHSITCCAL